MKRTATLFVSILLLIVLTGVNGFAADKNVEPFKIRISVNDDKDYASFQGLKVKVNTAKSDYSSRHFFITFNDLKKLAKRRKVKVNYDKAGKKLTVGKSTVEVIPVDPNSKDTFVFFKIRAMEYKGKTYFDTWGIYSGLGFGSVSRLPDGVNYYEKK